MTDVNFTVATLSYVTEPMRRAADEARSAALREDENDQIGALNAALDAAFASIVPMADLLDKVTDAVRKADVALAAARNPGLPAEVIAAAADRISGDYVAMAQAAVDAFPGAANALRYKYMFDDAVAQHNAQMARAEAAEADRDEARQIVRDIHWMARRYASGRQTYAPGMFNDAIRKAVGAGWLGARKSGDEPLFADDPAVNAAPCTMGSAE